MSMLAGSIHRNLLRRLIALAFGFWFGPSRKTAWLLSLGFLACLIANMLVAVGLNQWNKYFFDALQSHPRMHHHHIDGRDTDADATAAALAHMADRNSRRAQDS